MEPNPSVLVAVSCSLHHGGQETASPSAGRLGYTYQEPVCYSARQEPAETVCVHVTTWVWEGVESMWLSLQCVSECEAMSVDVCT